MKVLRACGASALLAALLSLAPQAARGQASVFPMRLLDRPTTLPGGATRFDAFAFSMKEPQTAASMTLVLGGAVGLTDAFEVGGQFAAIELAPQLGVTDPSLYALYDFQLSEPVSIAPVIQAIFPLDISQARLVDVGALVNARVGAWTRIRVNPMVSVNSWDGMQRAIVSVPVAVMRQLSDALNLQVRSGVLFARADPRFGLSRRRSALDLRGLTVPLSAELVWTLPLAGPTRPMVDLSAAVQWPELYWQGARSGRLAMDDWAVAVSARWYFVD